MKKNLKSTEQAPSEILCAEKHKQIAMTGDIKTANGRVRLSCDISRTCHRKLKIQAAETDKSIQETVEEMIDLHCKVAK